LYSSINSKRTIWDPKKGVSMGTALKRNYSKKKGTRMGADRAAVQGEEKAVTGVPGATATGGRKTWFLLLARGGELPGPPRKNTGIGRGGNEV